MNEKINELIFKLNAKDNKKAQAFLKIIEDMGLKDEIKLDGIVYMAFKAEVLTLEDIKNNYSTSTFATIEIL
ncbi:MAG: hypothetical protein J6Q13_00675 [Clostridia bacterium]|nr:hypothetical protein [Clostridia bacterium]